MAAEVYSNFFVTSVLVSLKAAQRHIHFKVNSILMLINEVPVEGHITERIEREDEKPMQDLSP